MYFELITEYHQFTFWMLGSKNPQKLTVFRRVYRFGKGHDQLGSIYRNSTNRGYGLCMIQLIIYLEGGITRPPIVSGHGVFCCAKFIDIQVKVAFILVLLELWAGIYRLNIDLLLMLGGNELGAPNLFLLNTCVPVAFSQGIGRYSPVRKAPMELHDPLLNRQANPLDQSFLGDDECLLLLAQLLFRSRSN